MGGHAGNRAAQRLVTATAAPGHNPVMREYKASSRQKNDLKAAVEREWGAAIRKEGSQASDVVDDLVGWCNSHSQALTIVSKLPYSKFTASGDPDAIELDLIGIKAEKAEVEVDPTVRALQEVKKAGRLPADFTDDELKTIVAMGQEPTIGWSKAVTQVWDLKEQARISAQLVQNRVAKYANSKLAGDVAFAAPNLLFTVWSASYGVATASSANKNAEVGNDYPDHEIIAAAQAWNHHAAVDKVDNFHVPGYPNNPIQDKSTRPVNPDPTRGRQADFISDWDGGAINIHVNSNVRH